MEKDNFDKKFMDCALDLSEKANCIKGKVGAIIVKVKKRSVFLK